MCPLADLESNVARLLQEKVKAVSAEAGARLIAQDEYPAVTPPKPLTIKGADGKKTYRCVEKGCGKICKRFPDYKKHYRTHGDNRPFPCRKASCINYFS
jgi:hypothetical protein